MRLLVLKLFRVLKSAFPYFLFLLIFSHNSNAQSVNGFLKGKVIDGSTYKTLSGVSVSNQETSTGTSTFADGSYLLPLKKGSYTLLYRHEGFQTKLITNINIESGKASHLDIILFPLAKKISAINNHSFNDSIKQRDSVLQISFYNESRLSSYNPQRNSSGYSDIFSEENIQPGTDKNALQVIKRLSGIVVQGMPSKSNLQSLNISGLGERYNQVLYNGAILNSFAPLSNSYPFDILPAEVIEKVSVQKIANSSLPAGFSGGNVEIKTRDFPEKDFFYVEAGTGFSDATSGKDFYEDKRNKFEFISFPGSIRNLPSGFPTTRSQVSFKAKTQEEQVSLSRLLNNNLAPINYGSSKPDDKILLGFGKIINLNKETKIGIVGFLNQSKSTLIDESKVQVAPEVSSNPFPFADDSKVLIRAQSKDINYRYVSHISSILNSSIVYGRNKISLSNFFGSQFTNTYTKRSQLYKPDEDTLAHSGINYSASQHTFLITQLSGEHALSGDGKFKLNWHASYSYSHQQNPDERNFLLRQDSVDINKFEIAQPLATPFNPPQFSDPNVYDPNLTNSGRLWRDLKDNNFEGAVNISVPYNLFNQAQVISGGVYIQSRNRVFHSDLLPTKGPGYYSLNDLLSPARYDSAGLSVTNYFSNFGGSYSFVYANNRANYNASANVGASYIRLESKLAKSFSVDWGARVESATQLVSNTQYNYVAGSSSSVILPLDKNTFITRADFLPSVLLKFQSLNNIQVHAAYFKTVNRPQLQELTSYRYYDAISFLVKIGNPILQNTAIANYDAGIKWIPHAGSTISISGFYKKIDQPIENILFSYTTGSVLSQPHNTPPATVYGLDAAFKMQLKSISGASWLSDFTIFADGNWLTSKVKAGPVRKLDNPSPEHTLSGSPDYTVNAGLVIQHSRFPEVTILYNRTGDYISALGSGKIYSLDNGNTISTIPDYRIKGREQLDIHVGQKIVQSKIQITAGVANLLDNSFIEYQDLNGNKKFDAPITLKTVNGQGGFYESGTDNTIISVKSQRTYYLTVSWLFK